MPNRAYSLAAATAMPNTGPMAKDDRDNSTQADLTVHETYDDHGNTQYAVYDGNGLGEISASINGLSARARQAWARQQGKSKDEIDQAGQGHPRY